MHATSHIFSTDYQPGVAAGILKRFTQVVIFLVLQGAILFTSAGDLFWTWAWIFLGISLASVLVNGAILLRVNPETIAERGHARFTRKWDKIISAIYSLFLFLIVPLVAGLDIRHSWSGGMEIAWHVVGAIGFTGGLALGGWAMIVNAYFSTAVRIQTDRGQTVCRAGPYRLVRHPGYAGFILQSLATPILLGSAWGLFPAAIATAALIVRTSLEDRVLRRELPGYEDYTQEVHFRLVPGIW